jgi:multidrug resistance efflux pump
VWLLQRRNRCQVATQPEPIAPITVTPVIQRAVPPDQASLAALLQFEGEVRRQASVPELVYHIANEGRRIVAYDQMFVLRQARIGNGFHVIAASSLATVDRNAPLVQAIEKVVADLAADRGLNDAHDLTASAYSDDSAVAEYPFHDWRWQPLKAIDGQAFAGLLVARSGAFREGEGVRLDRIAETVSHGWRALSGGAPVRRIKRFGRKERIGLMILLAAIALFPVRMSALAPMEVVATRPFMIAAPFAGVISTIHVPPNARVKAGQPLITFEDVKLSNEFKLATERLAVARARVERSTSAAFGAAEESREIAIMQAEFEVAQADYNYARDVMAKSQIAAPRGGMAIYSDRRDWEGRAVNVGDPIMQVADPSQVSFRIDLPAAEQMALKPGAPVKVWLDAQPLWSIDGRIQTASYQARPTADNVLAFAVTAKPTGSVPRIGSRGTAKLYGEWVPLSYALLKRPISSLRQFIGL